MEQRRVPLIGNDRRLLKFLLLGPALLVCGIALAALVGLYKDYEQIHRLPPARWWGLGLFTGLFFIVVLQEFRGNWTRPLFWLVMMVLLAMHLCGFAIVLRASDDWRSVWSAFITVAEYPVWVTVLWQLGFRPRAPRRSPRKGAGSRSKAPDPGND